MFILGGQPALDPSHILQGLRYDPWWKSKVNSFRDVRGVYPSVGYLLMSRASIKALKVNPDSDDPNSYVLQIGPTANDKPFLTFSVLINKITPVNSSKTQQDTETCLVELTDSRKYLQDVVFHENFNVVTSHTDSKLEFDKSTINGSTPWTWVDLIRKAFQTSGIKEEFNYSIQGYSYPTTPPCNLYTDGVTPATFLHTILNELGLLLIKNYTGSYSLDIIRPGTEHLLTDNLTEDGALNALQEISYSEYGPHSIPGYNFKYNFSSRKYLGDSDHPSAVDSYKTRTFWDTTKEVSDPISDYIQFVDSEENFFCSPVAYFYTGSEYPINKAELDSYINTITDPKARILASNYGPTYLLQGYHYYYQYSLISAVTYWENLTVNNSLSAAFTKIETANSAAYSHLSSLGNLPINGNFPDHKSIIVKPTSNIDKGDIGPADIIEYSVSNSSSQKTTVGSTNILNISGNALKSTSEYTADFNWQCQLWAVWPGASTNDDGGTGSGGDGDRLPVRFMLLEDMELTDTYQEAQLIDLQDRAINEDGDLVQGNPNPVPWTPFTAVQKGTRVISPTDVFNQQAPFEKLWSQGDTIRSKVDRTTLNIFDTISGEVFFWEKSTGTGDGKILVLDLEKKRYGYKAYDDPKYGEQIGYRGTAYFVTDNYNDTGKPGYVIQDMEHEARILEGKLIEGTADDESNPKSFYMDVERYWGNAPNGRPPKTTKIQGSGSEEESEYGVKIICRLGESIPNSNDTSRAMLDEAEQVYVLMSNKIEFKSEYIVLELELEP